MTTTEEPKSLHFTEALRHPSNAIQGKFDVEVLRGRTIVAPHYGMDVHIEDRPRAKGYVNGTGGMVAMTLGGERQLYRGAGLVRISRKTPTTAFGKKGDFAKLIVDDQSRVVALLISKASSDGSDYGVAAYDVVRDAPDGFCEVIRNTSHEKDFELDPVFKPFF